MLEPEDGTLILEDFRPVSTERRQEPRTVLSKRVWVFVPAHEPQIGDLIDCSPHGVGLLLGTRMREGDEFSLKLRIPLLQVVTYTVRYCQPQEGRFRIGALLCGLGGTRGHPDLELVFRALMEAATPPPNAT